MKFEPCLVEIKEAICKQMDEGLTGNLSFRIDFSQGGIGNLQIRREQIARADIPGHYTLEITNINLNHKK